MSRQLANAFVLFSWIGHTHAELAFATVEEALTT